MANRALGGTVVALTAAALGCFAGNSLLARAALRTGEIDAASYTLIRLGAGAVVLLALVQLRRARASPQGSAGSWPSAAALFLYAGPFSFAYLKLSAGTGALLLFGAVQLTMIGRGLLAGERPPPLEWAGLLAAIAGLVWLVLPGLAAPEPVAAALMLAAGAAWGWYSLRGRGAVDPLAATAGNFTRAVPVAILAALPFLPRVHASPLGAGLAVASGALASGVGYSLWYAALPSLTRLRAALVQLAVPLVAAAGGVLLLGEPLTARLAIAALAILGGISLAVLGRR